MRKIYVLIGLALATWCVKAQDLEPETNKKGRWGYVDNSGREVIKFKYDEAYPFEAGVAIVRKGDKMGFIDTKGKPIGKIQYSIIEPYASGELYLVAIGGKIDDKKPKKKTKAKQKTVSGQQSASKVTAMATKMMGSVQGAINSDPLLRSSSASVPKLEAVNIGGSSRIPWLGAKWGLCDSKGNMLVPAVYESLSDIIDGLIYVSKGGKYGVLTAEGKELVKPQFKTMGVFNKAGYCWVSASDADKNNVVKDKFGLINREGKLLVQPKYDLLGTFVETKDNPYGYYAAGVWKEQYMPFCRLPESTSPYIWFCNKDLKAGVVDKAGTAIIPVGKFTTVFAPTCGVVPVVQKKKMGFYDITTKKFQETNPQYVYSAFDHDLSRVNTGGLYYFVDKNLKQVSGQYSVATGFNEGFCVVGKGGKFGVIDASGREVIPLQYQNAKAAFHDGVLGVMKDGKWGFIKSSGEVEFPFIYESVDDFKNGFCTVSTEGRFGCMRRDGKLLLPMQWDDFVTPIENNPAFIWGKKENLFYCYDVVNGRLAFDQGYPDVTNFFNGVAAFVQEKSYGMVNNAGVEIIPAVMPNYLMLGEAYLYLEKIEKEVMSQTDLQRFYLFLSDKANTYKIDKGLTIIPEDVWDY